VGGHWQVGLAAADPRGDRLPDEQRRGLPLRPHRVRRPVLDHPSCGAEGGLVDEDAVHRRRFGEPEPGVHDVPGGHALAFGSRLEVDHGLAGRDRDPNAQLEPPLLAQLGHGVADGQGGADSALRIVLMGDGSAEEGQDGVADELLDPSAEMLQLGTHALGERDRGGADILGVALVAQRGRPDEVGEQDRDHLSFLSERAAE
jgi:hypothetical protein